MYVIKRSGKSEPIKYDKITERNLKIAKEIFGSNIPIDLTKLSQLIIQGLKSGMTTTEIDELSCETATHMSTYQPEYDKLAAAIGISNLHKSTEDSFLKTMRKLYNYTSEDGRKYGLISDEMFKFMTKNKEEIEKIIDYKRDFNYTYFGFKTLEKSYLLKIDNKVVERPQHMLMRCAIGIHGPSKKNKYEGNIQKVIETYNEISNGKFTHASPTLYNACSIRAQMSSCFLLHMDDDLNHMYQTALRSALISKYAGGIGIDISNIRCKGSKVHSTNGNSNGIIPMIKVFNQVALHCDQSGKRKGSIAMYLQPWHPDVLDFLQLRFNSPPEELRARDIFIAMWIPDIFMRRVEKDEMWTLICPSKCKELTNTYGEDFEKIYEECEQKGIFNKQIKARVIWDAILRSQEETGLPYMLYKDSVNNKSNQKNIGLIRSSNLCCEILEYTDKDSIAVCNLASIALPKYVYEDENKELKFDYKELGRITEMITENLNLIIDKNFYPVPEAEYNNLSYRPIGIGIQGLADVFAMLNYTWDSKEAKELNQKIFEYIYYHAVKKSNELAIKDGSYSVFKGSPISQGILQYNMWNKTPLSEELNWKELEENVKNGMRNSLLVAPMPTASTAQILNNNEAFEPFTSNIYSRSVLAGDFVCVNKHLYKKLKEINLWNKQLVDKIIANNGSIQKIDEIPKHIKDIYKTVWEIPQRILIDMAADRGAFIDQSQSLNIFIDHPTHAKLSSMHFYGWKKGLKTGSYYIRSKPSREAIKFTIDNKTLKGQDNKEEGECLMCSS